MPNAWHFLPLQSCRLLQPRTESKATRSQVADAPSTEDFHILTVYISIWNGHAEDMSLSNSASILSCPGTEGPAVLHCPTKCHWKGQGNFAEISLM